MDLVKEFDPMPSNILLILPPCEILRLLEPWIERWKIIDSDVYLKNLSSILFSFRFTFWWLNNNQQKRGGIKFSFKRIKRWIAFSFYSDIKTWPNPFHVVIKSNSIMCFWEFYSQRVINLHVDITFAHFLYGISF